MDYLTEAMALFKDLSPENQANLLMYTRVAYTAENAVKKSISRALNGGEDVTNVKYQ